MYTDPIVLPTAIVNKQDSTPLVATLVIVCRQEGPGKCYFGNPAAFTVTCIRWRIMSCAPSFGSLPLAATGTHAGP